MADEIKYTELRKQVEKIGKDLIIELTNELLKADKKASGNLINSLKYEVVEVLGNLMIKLKAQPYLINVDKGRRPGKMPPVSPIMKWIDLKKIKPKDISKKQLAFVIAKSIGRKGIKPTNVIQKAKDNIIKAKKEILAKAAQKDVMDALSKILTTL